MADRTSSDPQTARTTLVGVLALVLVTLVVRGFALSADPLPDTEGGFIWDWGEWAKNARLHALLGRWTVDDFNQALYLSPGYTLALRLAFGLFGVGQAQASLLSAFSGLAMVLLVYWVVSAHSNRRTGFAAGFLLAINPFMIVHDRSGYPESFQLLFVLLAALAVLSERNGTAALGGIAAGLAIVAKGTGLVIGPIVAVGWTARWVGTHYLGLEPRFRWQQFASYAAAAAATLLVFCLTFVIPHWDEIVRHLPYASKGILTATSVGARPDRVSLFGFHDLGFRMNGFFSLQWYLIGVVAVFAATRIARVLRQPASQLELICWAWLGFGGLYLARMYYQPDRRFLILAPPLAVLAGLFLGREIALGSSAWTGRLKTAAFAVAGAGLAGVFAFYLVRFAGPYRVMAISERMGHPLTYSASAGLLVTSAVVAAALVGALLAGQFRWRPTIRWQWVLVPVICAGVAVRWAGQLAHRTYTIDRVGRILTRFTGDWPADERFMRGGTAATFAMNTPMFGVNLQFQGLPTEQRFHTRLYVMLETGAIRFRPALLHDGTQWPDKVECAQIRIWPRPNAGIYTAHLLVEPDRLAACQEAVRVTP